MDGVALLLYLGTRMQELKDECQNLREAGQYTQADMYYARYDELGKVVNKLKELM